MTVTPAVVIEPIGQQPVEPIAPATRSRVVRTRQRVLAACLLGRPAEYARPLRPHWVTRLVREWNKRKVGVLLVSQRPDGSFRALTGNHRVASRLQDGEPDYAFDCLVYENLSLQEEAAIYLAQDDERLRHSVADDFPAMLVNDDPIAKGVQRCLDAVGLEVAPYGEAGHKKNRVRCVSALLNAYETNGEDDLTRALGLLRDEWGEEEHHPTNPKKSIYSEATVNSLPAFLRLYGAPDQRPLDYPWLRKAMARDGLEGWERAWMRHRAESISKPQGGVAILYGVLAWIDLYNRSRREQNKLDDLLARRNSHALRRRARRMTRTGGRP